MDWIEFALAMALFMASHRIPMVMGIKGRLIRSIGQRGYGLLFSLASTLLLWWVIAAAGRAPFIVLWDQETWHRWLVNIVMPLAIALGCYGIAAPNPFAFEGRASGFDPAHPGIAGLTRQPLLWALTLWSGAHLLANGDLAHVILFGSFLLFSLVGPRMVERRKRREMGAAEWERLAAHTGAVPFAALLAGRWRPSAPPPLLRSVLVGLVWVGLWHLHGPVIGVWPAP